MPQKMIDKVMNFVIFKIICHIYNSVCFVILNMVFGLIVESEENEL